MIIINFLRIIYIEGMYVKFWMDQKGMNFDHNFYVVVGKQRCTENAYTGHQYNVFFYRLTNVLILFICFKLVMKF